MATLQETLDMYQPYVLGIRYMEGHVIVDCLFKDGWVIPEVSLITKVVNKEVNFITLFSQDKAITLDDILAYIWNIIQINKEKEDKRELFKKTVENLKEIFKGNSLVKLKTLRLLFGDSIINDDEVIEENSEVVNPPLEVVAQIFPEEEVTIPQPQIEEIPVGELSEEELEILEEEKRAAQYFKQRGITKQNSFVKDAITETVVKSPTLKVSSLNCECECDEGEACSKCIDNKDF